VARSRNAEKLRRGAAAVEAERVRALAGATDIRVGAYTRISDDQEDELTGDRGAGVARQFEAIEQLCQALSMREIRWKIEGPAYEDNDVSAFKDVLRPEFERLLSDLEAGVIDGIVVYDLDRLARRPKDLERIIEIYDRAAKSRRTLYFRTVHDVIDLSSPDGITLARVMVAFANKASRDTGRRVAAKHRATALTGRPVSGTRPFGWDWTRSQVTLADGRVLPEVTKPNTKGNQTVNKAEAEELRRIADDLLLGCSINSVVRDLNGRNIRTSKGNRWTAATLKQLILSPRLVGYRVHQKEILIDPKTQNFVKGQWDPILPEEKWTALEDLLLGDEEAASERRSEAHREYFLSGLLRCSECSGPLHGNARNEKHFYYACKARGGGVDGEGGCGKVSASGVAVDELIADLLRARMRTTEPDDTEGSGWQGAEELEITKAKIRANLEGFSSAEGELAQRLLAQVRDLQEQADALRLERNEWVRERSRRRRLVTIGPEVWEDLSVADRRAYARTELEAIYVRRATRRGNRFDPGRLVPIWRNHAPADA
jgi:site-specific DNA recombinase